MRLIVTDLDGTLIDHHTYSADAALPALAAARARRAPVVPCSSKTLAEMRVLATQLALQPAPLIVENGSAIWFPDTWTCVPEAAEPWESGGRVLVLGVRAGALRPLLTAVATSVGADLRGFSAMTDVEVADRTGLSLDTAALARARDFSEPFVCVEGDVELARLNDAARTRGARVTRGGRFFHLTGLSDKGEAVNVLRTTCGPGARLLGLGDAPNDISLLLATDDAAIVPRPSHGPHPDLVAALPAAIIAPAPGPAGWNDVVLAWLSRDV